MRDRIVALALVSVGAAWAVGAAGAADRDGVLLPDGDRARGELAFRRVGCARCHVLPEEGAARGRDQFWIRIALGKATSRMTDGELGTELILPSRRIHPSHISRDEEDPSASPMPTFAPSLTVQELADLVAFLRPRFPRPPVDPADRRDEGGPLAAPAAEADERRVALPRGEAARGRSAYLSNGCGICHRVDGIELATGIDQPAMEFVLGGPGLARPSRGELATEIASPDHRVTVSGSEGRRELDADSPMPSFARRLSVRDLADLVAFLYPAYR